MVIRIIGGGSLGLLFAAKLALSGKPAELVTRTENQARTIRENGVHLLAGAEEKTVHLPCVSISSAQAARNSAPAQPSDPEWIFLMVKQQHIRDDLLAFIRETLSEKTNVLCFQNGIGHVERLRKAVPAERLYLAVTTEAALRENSFVVRHTGQGTTLIGQPDPLRANHAPLFFLLRDLADAGFSAEMSKDINEKIWHKLLINSVINPLTAIFNVRNGQLLASLHRIRLMEKLFAEGISVARAEKIAVPDQLWEQLLDVCRKTGDNISSMLGDVRARRETEIDWITGSIMRLAEVHQLSVPTHHAVYHIIKGLSLPDRLETEEKPIE
jgi:2-dehydropantoate 2-reductase